MRRFVFWLCSFISAACLLVMAAKGALIAGIILMISSISATCCEFSIMYGKENENGKHKEAIRKESETGV